MPSVTASMGNTCVGCRATGRCRFGLLLRPLEDGSVDGTAFFTAEHEGAGGVVHGGSTMGALDEACGCVVLATGVIGVTAEMDVRFRRPVPVGRELQVRAWPESRDERGHWMINAEITLEGEDRALCVARARFVERDPTMHYGRFRDWLTKSGTAGSETSGGAGDISARRV